MERERERERAEGGRRMAAAGCCVRQRERESGTARYHISRTNFLLFCFVHRFPSLPLEYISPPSREYDEMISFALRGNQWPPFSFSFLFRRPTLEAHRYSSLYNATYRPSFYWPGCSTWSACAKHISILTNEQNLVCIARRRVFEC